MRRFVWILFFLVSLPLSAQEAVPSVMRDREVLPEELWRAYDKAKTSADNAVTTIEMMDASGPVENAAVSLLAAAAAYRLKRLSAEEQIKLLKDLYDLGCITEQIAGVPRDGTGTMESVYRSWHTCELMFHYVKIWTLSDLQYEQWKKIGFADFEFDGVRHKLKNGLCSFLRKNEEGCQRWTITILPQLFLECKGNLFVLVAVDCENARTANLRISCFCRLGSDNILHPINRYEEKKFVMMKVTDKAITFYNWGEYPAASILLSEL